MIMNSLWTLMRRWLDLLSRIKARVGGSDTEFGTRVGIAWSARCKRGGAIRIGDDVTIQDGVILQPAGGRIVIGSHGWIGPYSVIDGTGGVTVGDSVLMASHVQVYSYDLGYDDPDVPMRCQDHIGRGVTIGDDVWVGCGAIILAGVRIGDGAVIGAGSVVTKDIPSFAVVAGVPARIMKMRGQGERVLADHRA